MLYSAMAMEGDKLNPNAHKIMRRQQIKSMAPIGCEDIVNKVSAGKKN